jgi:hypothetical protein
MCRGAYRVRAEVQKGYARNVRFEQWVSIARGILSGVSSENRHPTVSTMKAFEDLYHEHVAAVFRFAMSVAARRDAAEDLTSEAFLALYRNLNSIDETRLPGWLLTVVRNRARDLWRHQEVEQRHAGTLAASPVAPDGLPLEQCSRAPGSNRCTACASCSAMCTA